MTDLFDVLADETRRDIVTLLHRASSDDNEMSVGELVDALGITQPTVSKHLKVLREAGVVRVREDGQHRFYRLDKTPLVSVNEWLAGFTGGATANTAEPFVDLTILGRATGGLLSDGIDRVWKLISGIGK
jgi:ArsR family transcriptional regulator, arsenate/arsenite/antimonite-responsive transcriptional repressor